jgi:peptidyl-tRNA hydrolase, PTH1 family
VGFWTVEAVQRLCSDKISLKKPLFRAYLLGRAETAGLKLALAKPLTYMNRSGDAVPAIMRKTGTDLDELLIVCDNMDLPPGELRFRLRGGGAGQKGMNSIIDSLGTDKFPRIFVGIGRPAPGVSVVDHVLGVPGPEEAALLREAVGAAAEGILRMGREPAERIMNELNGRKADR